MSKQSPVEKPMELEAMDAAKITSLDVRPILKSGGEPFSAIMDAISKTAKDGAFKLRATFKPSPLFHVLGMKGWQHWVEFGEGDDWIVWFYRSGSGDVQKTSQAEIRAAHLQKEFPELRERLTVEADTWYLDVKRLSPPEPMEMTLTVLEKLPQNTRLVQLNERVPQFLLPVLLERGFTYSIEPGQGSEVRLQITRS